MKDSEKQQLLSRNYPFISEALQEKLSRIHVGLIGVGLSSQIAESLVRIGVQKLSLWDHDSISISNLNRQAFTFSDIGKNKAEIVGNSIKTINPDIDVQVHNAWFTESDLEDGLKGIDIVVNSADFDNALVYDIGDRICQSGGWCIQPLNLGFGGACMVFGKNSPSLSVLTNGRQNNSAGFVQNLLASSTGFNPGPELVEAGESLLTGGDADGFFPQNVIATMITTSLVTWAITQITSGKGENISAPRLLHFEPKI